MKEENIFETSVPGCYELPLAARFLALSGTVDAIVCAGVLIKGEVSRNWGLASLVVLWAFSADLVSHELLWFQTQHFEYISDAVSSGLMSVQLQTSLPVVYGVLNCMDEAQVKARSSGNSNHGYDWGKTAVEMGLLRMEAMNIKAANSEKLGAMGFGKADGLETDKRAPAPRFF